MVDFGPEFSSLAPSEQSAVQLCVDELGKEYPEAASSVTVSKTAVGLTLTIVAPGKYEQIVSAMVEPITSIMLSTGVLLFLTQGRRDASALQPRPAPQKEAPAPQKEAPPPQKEAPPPQKEAPPPQKEAPPPQKETPATPKPSPPSPAAPKPATAPVKTVETKPEPARAAAYAPPAEIVCTCGNLVPVGEPYCNVCGNIVEDVAPQQATVNAPTAAWPLTIPTALKTYANSPAAPAKVAQAASALASAVPRQGRTDPSYGSSATSLYQDGQHFNVRTTDDPNSTVDLTRHVIIHGQSAMLLDPGGYKVFPRIMSEMESVLGRRVHLEHIVLSHEGPDVASGLNSWMMTTKATTWISSIWSRFVPHYGLDERYASRLRDIPDEGLWLALDSAPIAFVPAHFQHSAGNLHVWDPTSRILYTSDLGSSLERGFRDVHDFDEQARRMRDYHRRHIVSKRAMTPWVRMVEKLDPRMIVPQHGPHFEGPEMVRRFLDWCLSLDSGIDLLPPAFELPPK